MKKFGSGSVRLQKSGFVTSLHITFTLRHVQDWRSICNIDLSFTKKNYICSDLFPNWNLNIAEVIKTIQQVFQIINNLDIVYKFHKCNTYLRLMQLLIILYCRSYHSFCIIHQFNVFLVNLLLSNNLNLGYEFNEISTKRT